jgi:SAM-dependent methyltransferase
MAKETSKAMRRRWREDAAGSFPWRRILTGRGLDVGCGDDKLPFEDCKGFDMEDGDANKLSEYFPAESFDYIHSSQSLEHMHNPEACLRDWLKLVKPGGYVIVSVPSWELYEGMRWPSVYNPDHKSTWSMNLRGSPAGKNHIHVPSFLLRMYDVARALIFRQLDENYDYAVGVKVDQTWIEADGVEPWIEFVLQKKSPVLDASPVGGTT